MVNFVRGGTRIYGMSAKSTAAPRDRSLVGRADTSPAQEENGPAQGDNYLSALLKLIPAEVISIYMAIRDSASQHHFLAQWFVLCLITCIIFRAYSNLPGKADSTWRDIQGRSVLVSAIAFFLWAFAIGSEPPIPQVHLDPWLASALAALFGLLAPLLVPGDTKDQAS